MQPYRGRRGHARNQFTLLVRLGREIRTLPLEPRGGAVVEAHELLEQLAKFVAMIEN